MKALIIAAGDGTRLQSYSRGQNKCLLPLLGLKIIERVILSAKEAKIQEFVIILGYQGKNIQNFLDDGKKYGVKINYVVNPDWKKENGISVLKAKPYFKQHFALLMSDHIFDSKTLIAIQRVKLSPRESILAIDKNLESILEANDVTKVFVKNNRIFTIGKELITYNAYDTGMFICSPYIFKILSQTVKQNQNSLTDGIKILAKKQLLRGYDIKGRFWADCDTYEDLKFAEKKLLQNLTKPEDGIISQKFNRKISTLITKQLIKIPITPNTVSLLNSFLVIPTFFLLLKGDYPWLFWAGLLIQFNSILDGCDGEIARLKFLKSSWGAFFDTILDRYVDVIIIFGMVFSYWLQTKKDFVWILGFWVVVSLLLDIFSSREIKLVTKKELNWRGTNIRRDTRLLIIALGVMLNQFIVTFLILLLILNYKILRRLFYFSRINISS